jgi:hypothetical protein
MIWPLYERAAHDGGYKSVEVYVLDKNEAGEPEYCKLATITTETVDDCLQQVREIVNVTPGRYKLLSGTCKTDSRRKTFYLDVDRSQIVSVANKQNSGLSMAEMREQIYAEIKARHEADERAAEIERLRNELEELRTPTGKIAAGLSRLLENFMGGSGAQQPQLQGTASVSEDDQNKLTGAVELLLKHFTIDQVCAIAWLIDANALVAVPAIKKQFGINN